MPHKYLVAHPAARHAAPRVPGPPRYRKTITTADIFRDTFIAFLRVRLLHHEAQGPVYRLEMTDELARHGYGVSPGTLFPIFHRLERAVHLRSDLGNVNGKVRKYYGITEAEREASARLRFKTRRLVGEVLSEPDPVSPSKEELS